MRVLDTYRDNEAFVSLIERVRSLRRGSTNAEQLLWRLLRSRQLRDAKFRRQHQFGKYILDFYCAEARLAVEVDGLQHASSLGIANDAVGTDYLVERGIRVLRFTNSQVLDEPASVLSAIGEALASEPSP